MIDTQAIRNRILQLALRGQLTPQYIEDGIASVLVAELSGKLKEQPYISDIEGSEIPYEIPASWVWCRLSDIGSTNIGLTYHPEDTSTSGTIVARSSNIVNGKMDYSDLVRVTCQIRDNQYLEKNDILICARNGSKALVGKCAIFEGESKTVAFGAFMAVFRTPLFRYVYYYFNTPVFKRNFISDDSKQINQVTQNILKQSLIPIPPLAEQQRIVERIEQVFSILDAVDELQAQYDNNLTVLKSKLIDAALQGKLTEQLTEDGTAEELYHQIQMEKQALIKSGKVKKEKPLPKIAGNDVPFVIPKTWKWIRWGELSNQIQYGYNAPAKETGRIRMIRITDIQGNHVNWSTVPFCDIDEEYIEGYRVQPNDILFARTGGTVGKSYLVETVEEDAVFAGYLIRTSYSQDLNAKYMKYFMESRLYWKQLHDGTTATAQPNCNAKTLSKMMLPLPPKAEQDRIVERLDATIKTIET